MIKMYASIEQFISSHHQCTSTPWIYRLRREIENDKEGSRSEVPTRRGLRQLSRQASWLSGQLWCYDVEDFLSCQIAWPTDRRGEDYRISCLYAMHHRRHIVAATNGALVKCILHGILIVTPWHSLIDGVKCIIEMYYIVWYLNCIKLLWIYLFMINVTA